MMSVGRTLHMRREPRGSLEQIVPELKPPFSCRQGNGFAEASSMAFGENVGYFARSRISCSICRSSVDNLNKFGVSSSCSARGSSVYRQQLRWSVCPKWFLPQPDEHLRVAGHGPFRLTAAQGCVPVLRLGPGYMVAVGFRFRLMARVSHKTGYPPLSRHGHF